MKNILIVDNDKIIGVTQLLNKYSEEFKIVDFVKSAEEVPQIINSNTIDLLITDISDSNSKKIGYLADVLKNKPDLNVLAFSIHNDPEHILSALDLGVKGFVNKEEDSVILSAIRKVSNGGTYYKKNNLLEAFSYPWLYVPSITETVLLTKREKEILSYVVKGFSSPMISAEICISSRTVDVHRGNVLKKFGVKNSIELVKKVVRSGYLNA